MNNITIEVNGDEQEIPSGATLIDVIEVLNLPSNGCVFSINNTIVSKNKWSMTPLNSGDSISLFQAFAGG
ncbi:sulfur carrier protein ThiS [Vibrio sp. ZSDE26]|uniref:Sulfur carrier protein ThiS n=1 Tax=Vibrio amylolyticus TaxID=2847292 RepID=A0A9X1XMC6_9VIBR|nr:sulfur carrier protein ThiS [Vibrio amylolyticus]